MLGVKLRVKNFWVISTVVHAKCKIVLQVKEFTPEGWSFLLKLKSYSNSQFRVYALIFSC